MRLRVSDGYSAAFEFDAANETQFIDRCARAIIELHRSKIPHYQTRKLEHAAKYHSLQLHTKTVLDQSARQWSWVAQQGYFARVTVTDLFLGDGPRLWKTAEYTQRHGSALAAFLGGMGTWLRDELNPPRPALRLV
jgi:hypothetical protein